MSEETPPETEKDGGSDAKTAQTPAQKTAAKVTESKIAKKILGRKKDPALQKKLLDEQLDFDNSAEGQIENAIKNSKLKARGDKKRKQYIKYGASIAGVLFVGYVGYGLFKPYQAGLTFGVCKIFLEQNTRYPHTLKLSTVEELNNFVRIWYTQIDAFGEYRLENIQCNFEADEITGGRLSRVTFSRREVDPEKVAAFNKMLPIIFANPPDLTYPRPIPDRLEDMRIQTHLFRKPIL